MFNSPNASLTVNLGGANGFQAALSVGATVPLVVIGLLIRKHLVRGLSFGFVRR